MRALTETQIRDSLVNTTVRETRQAVLPDLDAVRWDQIEYLGWRDPKRDLVAYVVAEVDGEVVGICLRTQPPSAHRRKMMCAWCEDVTIADPAVLYVARRAGAAGRKGDTIGTAVCAGFRCSANVRRAPSITEVSGASEEEKAYWTSLRIEELRTRVAGFVREVAASA